MIAWTQIRLWLHGVVAAFVSASLTTLASVVVSPELSFHELSKVALMGGIVGTAAYFTKSPVKQ